MFMSRHQTTVQNRIIELADKSFKNTPYGLVD
jgi:hypothetical protein